MRDPQLYGTDETVISLLGNSHVWAVAGLGTDPEKPVFRVAQFLQKIGKTVVPIHPRGIDVLGVHTYTSLEDAAKHHEIDVVDCFVASTRVGGIVDEAIALNLPAVWMQLEIVDENAATRAIEHGLHVVMDRCPAIEWPRLMAGREL
jgi:predicted CoA-binding protein